VSEDADWRTPDRVARHPGPAPIAAAMRTVLNDGVGVRVWPRGTDVHHP
jgi:hypothetical protein